MPTAFPAIWAAGAIGARMFSTARPCPPRHHSPVWHSRALLPSHWSREIGGPASMAERYPGYNVLNKRSSVSWNDQTRAVIDARTGIDPEFHRFCDEAEWRALRAICDQIIP